MSNSGQTTRTIVWAVVVLFALTMATIVAVMMVAEPNNRLTLVVTLLPQLGAIAAVLVNLRATAEVGHRVERVADDTHKLTNGLLDSKVRAGVAEVVHPELVDPAYGGAERARDIEARDHTTEPPR